jgi:hypothetical protein
VIDTVQRSASNLTQATGVDPGAILNAVNQPASGDGVTPVNLLAPPAQNQASQTTSQPSQQISVDT